MLKRISLFVIVLSIFYMAVECMNIGKNEGLPDYKLKAGQVWKYKNRPGEDDSVITILKVEQYDKLGTLVHISVENLKLTNADNNDVTFQAINYMVFDEKSINDSVTELVKENDKLPDFEYNYNVWKKSFDQGMAGISSEPIANTLDILEEIMN